MARTDVRLDEGGNQNWVTVDAAAVNARASDLMLDSPARRGQGGDSVFRRALVHDFTDGLTINWDNDYPGGVTLHGVAHLYPKSAGDNELQRGLRAERLVAVHGGIVYETRSLGADLQPHVQEHNLGVEVAELQRQVAALTQRVAALEAR